MSPFRLRKRIKLLPGVHLNVGKRGASVSAGVRGAHVTVGHGKTRTTVGIPGTGVSHTSTTSAAPATRRKKRGCFGRTAATGAILLLLLGLLLSR